MNVERYVLDTSAVLTLIEDEPGAERVEEVLRTGRAFLPFMTLLETYYISLRERGPDEADRRYALLKQLPATIIWGMDEPTLLTAGRFKSSHRLSLSDAIIAALALMHQAVLLHKDPEYSPLANQVRQEALPFKTGDP